MGTNYSVACSKQSKRPESPARKTGTTKYTNYTKGKERRDVFLSPFTSSIRKFHCEGNLDLLFVSLVSFVVNFIHISQAVRVTETTKYTSYTKE